MKSFLFVFGTRPEAIKMAPLILRLRKNPKLKVYVCSTGQHREMLKPLLQFFNITPDYDLDLMTPGQTLSTLSSQIMLGLQNIINQQKIDKIVVQGDTTSSFIGGLLGFYNKIDVVHVEAGLRSGNINSPFPEEFNRRALSLITKLHLAPTDAAKNNLVGENVSANNIHVTGNTGIDALLEVVSTIQNSTSLTKQFESQFDFLNKNKKLILVTVHRRESFENNIKVVMEATVQLASQRSDVEFLIPLHLNPEVRKNAAQILEKSASWINGVVKTNCNIWLSDPIDYIPFVYLMNRSHLIITDSGGIQEEAPTLGKPVLIARENTERPEAITAGTSMLIPLQKNEFVAKVNELLDDANLYSSMAKAGNPFGDGKACERIESLLI